MADVPDIDLYADDLGDDFHNDGEEPSGDAVDLYDDVLTSTSSIKHENSNGTNGNTKEKISSSASSTGSSSSLLGGGPSSSSLLHHPSHPSKRVQLYVGNLTWWTTDADVENAITGVGVTDLVEVRFHENRANGQSKGFCVITVGSEQSARTCMDKLPKRELHGQNPVVTFTSKQALNQFEAQSKSRPSRQSSPPRSSHSGPSGVPSLTVGLLGPPPGSHGSNGPPGGGPTAALRSITAMMSLGLSAGLSSHGPPPLTSLSLPPPPSSSASRNNSSGIPVPPPGHHPLLPHPSLGSSGPHRGPPPMNLGLSLRGPPPGLDSLRSLPPPNHHRPEWPGASLLPPGHPHQHHPHHQQPAPHVNPAFFPPPGVPGAGHLPPPGFPPPHQAILGQPPPFMPPSVSADPSGRMQSDQQAPPAISEAEFEEVMGRNRTVSSSAIARAVADASIGDFGSAIETLVTAISLIKQSKVAQDERCKILVSSLQDTLHGIEAKSYGSRSNRERSRSRDRERRSRRGGRSRSRDRGERDHRDRDRERDRSDRDYSGGHVRERSDRDRERSRSHERGEYREVRSSGSGRDRGGAPVDNDRYYSSSHDDSRGSRDYNRDKERDRESGLSRSSRGGDGGGSSGGGGMEREREMRSRDDRESRSMRH